MAGMVVVFPDETWTEIENARVAVVSDEEIENRALNSPIPFGEPASAALASLETVMDGKAPREIALHVRMLLVRYADPHILDREKESIRQEIERVYLKAVGSGKTRGEPIDCTTAYQREEENG